MLYHPCPSEVDFGYDLGNRLKRIPLSAFIVEDMMEYVQAHATYRFYVVDEEEEKPRLLVRVFRAFF